jgi:1,4-alpha-glucan branching enzyme
VTPRLSIVLHTHMPYVEGFGTWPFGEEWLWEAIATSYLPLLDVLDAHPGKVTLSITPVLADQLEAPGALERCLKFLREIRPASHGLDALDHPEVAAQIAYSSALYESAVESLERRGDLIAAFAPHVTWTSAATHAVLPLVATDAGVRLQVETGIASHRRRFGAWDGGFWLPECAHAPWLDALLEEAGVHMTCVDWSASRLSGPHTTEAGVFLVGIDREAVDRVWDERGYPAHGDYRDSHRLTARSHAFWANDGTPYDPERGAARARADAEAFVASFDGPAVVAFDTELFGHHWHEGVNFLRRVLELADVAPLVIDHAYDGPSDPAPSSWGLGRDLRTWSRGELVWTQRSAELAALSAGKGGTPSRALRELLALQSSDWAFQIFNASAGEYPRERAEGHFAGLSRALDEDPRLRNLAPDLASWAFVQP